MKAADQILYRAKNNGRNQGIGAWPDPKEQDIEPLALNQALQAGQLKLPVVE